MKVEEARFNMVEQQVRPWEVLDQRVLDTLTAVPREEFVPAAYRQLAFSDTEIPLGEGEVMLSPKLQARMMQALALGGVEHVLEVGTGSGYGAALLSSLAGTVVSVDIREAFVSAAVQILARTGFDGITIAAADGLDGHPQHGPYDAIMLTGACAALPEAVLAQLAPGGRLVCVCGTGAVQEVWLYRRGGDDAVSSEALFETRIPYLVGAEPKPVFDF